jgi:hypothetical protein
VTIACPFVKGRLVRPVETTAHVEGSIPHNVWIAGWSAFSWTSVRRWSIPLVPLFLTSSLGASKSIVGLIEGIAEAAASLLKLFSA